jgi:hypothetical protein
MNSASSERGLWALQEFCFVRGSMAWRCLLWWEGIYQEMEIFCCLVNVSANVYAIGLLMFVQGYNSHADISGIAREQPNGQNRPGPTITGVIDNRLSDASHNPLSGYIIEDGCIPEPFKAFIQIMFMWQTVGKRAQFSPQNFRLQLRQKFAALKSLIIGPYANGGAIQRTATYLVMSHDSNELTLTLKGDKLVLRAPAEGRSEHFARVKGIMNKALGHFGEKMGYSYFYGTTSTFSSFAHWAKSVYRS